MDEWLVQPSSPSLSFPLLPSPFFSFLLLSSRLLSSAISVSPYSPRVAVQHEVNINSSAKHPRFIWLLQFPGCEKVGMCDATSECFSVPQMFFNQAKLLLYCFVDVIVISTFALPSVVIQSLMWSVLYHVCVTVWALPESDATVHLSGWFITNPSSTVLCGLSGSLLPFTVRYMNGVLSLYEWLSENVIPGVLMRHNQVTQSLCHWGSTYISSNLWISSLCSKFELFTQNCFGWIDLWVLMRCSFGMSLELP